MMAADGILLEPPGFVDASTTVKAVSANSYAAAKSILHSKD